MVNTQAAAIERATPQRTADSRRVAPTALHGGVVKCVVGDGNAVVDAVVGNTGPGAGRGVTAAAGVRLMVRRPIVRKIRQPPAYVPALVGAAEARNPQIGTWN